MQQSFHFFSRIYLLLVKYKNNCANGSSMKDVRTLGEGGASKNSDKSREGEGGGLAICGHPFQCCFWKREEGI